VSGLDLVWTLRDRLELLAFDARLAGVPQTLLEALWEAIDAPPALPAAPLEQLPASVCLGVGWVLDLVPDGVRGVGIGLALGHDSLEVEPLRRGEQVPAALLDREHLR
jgi:hypothetical protein